MSLPKELLDQLLTGYLDDALSQDERARVDHLLQTDDSVADELAQLEDLRTSLKAVSLADSDIKLDAGFADRVLGEAVARARAEGLSEDHPLMRLEEQPSKALPAAASSSSWKFAGVMVGLAASIVFAVLLLRPDDPNGTPGGQIAQVDSSAIPPKVTDSIPESGEPIKSSLAPGRDQIASSATKIETVAEAIDAPPVSPSPEEVMPKVETTGDAKIDVGTIASVDAPAMDLEIASPEAVGVNPDQQLGGLGAIMVLNVTRSAEGREPDAVRAAMQLASINPPSEKRITEEVAGFVKDSSLVREEDGATVLYLQAPAKDLDRLYLRLMADEVGIESIGMTLAMNAPVMNLVNNLRQDPTTIQHEQASLQLVSDDAALAHLAGELGGMEYLTDRGVSIPSSGSDEMGEMLLLIR